MFHKHVYLWNDRCIMKLIIAVCKLGLIKGKLSLMKKVDIIPVMVRLIKVVRWSMCTREKFNLLEAMKMNVNRNYIWGMKWNWGCPIRESTSIWQKDRNIMNIVDSILGKKGEDHLEELVCSRDEARKDKRFSTRPDLEA